MNDDLYYPNHWLDNEPEQDAEPDDNGCDSKYFNNPGYNPLMRVVTPQKLFIENGGLIAGDKAYISVEEAAIDNDLNIGALRSRLRSGWKVEDAITTPLMDREAISEYYDSLESANYARHLPRHGRAFSVAYNGKKYHSFAAFCKAYDLPYRTCIYHFEKNKHDMGKTIEDLKKLGYIQTDNDSCEYRHEPDNESTVVVKDETIFSSEDVAKGNAKKRGVAIPCEYEGIKYPSVRALANSLSISYICLIRKISTLGLSVEDAVNECLIGKRRTRKYTEIEYEGEIYNSIAQLAEIVCVNASTLLKHLQQGETAEEAITKIRRDSRNTKLNRVSQHSTAIYCFGAKFDSLHSLAATYGLNWEDLFDQMAHYGYKPREAVLKLVKQQGVEEYLQKQKDRP